MATKWLFSARVWTCKCGCLVVAVDRCPYCKAEKEASHV